MNKRDEEIWFQTFKFYIPVYKVEYCVIRHKTKIISHMSTYIIILCQREAKFHFEKIYISMCIIAISLENITSTKLTSAFK